MLRGQSSVAAAQKRDGQRRRGDLSGAVPVSDMKIRLICVDCYDETGKPWFVVKIREDGLYRGKCPAGHDMLLATQTLHHEMLFEIARAQPRDLQCAFPPNGGLRVSSRISPKPSVHEDRSAFQSPEILQPTGRAATASERT